MAIITISRKVGSLGEEIARLVAQRTGYSLVGGPEFHKLAMQCDQEFSQACTAFESERSTGFFERLFFREPANLAIFYAMNYDLAAQGDVIIKGRGAQIVFADHPGVLKIRVVAPDSVRISRIMERKDLTKEQAADFMRRFDRARRGLIESVFHHDLADIDLYDLVLNTKAMDAQSGAQVVCALAEHLVKPASDQTKEEYRRLALAKRVEAAIKKKVGTSPYRDLLVSSPEQGIMVLQGYVQEKRSRELAERIAREYPGVSQVENRLKTTELSF